MPRKKTANDEKRLDILIRKRENERKLLAGIKSDPISTAQLKEKQHLKYLKKKEKGQIKSIIDLSIREQRKLRRFWKENQRRHRARKKINLEDSHFPKPAENKILEQPLTKIKSEQPWPLKKIMLEQQETLRKVKALTNTKTLPLKSTNEQLQLLTSIKLEKDLPSTSTKILEQPQTLSKSKFYIRSKDLQPVSSESIKLEKPQHLKFKKIMEQRQPSTNSIIKEPSTSTKILEHLQPFTTNRFYIRSKDEPAPSTGINVFWKPQPSTSTKIFGQTTLVTSNNILEQPQPSTNANIFGKCQPSSTTEIFGQVHPLTRTKVLESSQPSSNTKIFGQPLTTETTKIFAQPQPITKGRFYIRIKEEVL